MFFRLFWFIVAEDGDNGVGFAIPTNSYPAYKKYHQHTLGLDGVE